MGDVGSDAKALQTWVTSLWDSPKAGTLLWADLEPCLCPGALHSPWSLVGRIAGGGDGSWEMVRLCQVL